ncbi:MAG: hypothetical protein IPH84_10835 [Bacteroidales bacterium]|nr:hypothetical protein [Bacteroidales bacterium]
MNPEREEGVTVIAGLVAAAGATPKPSSPAGKVAGVVETVENLKLGSVQAAAPVVIPVSKARF